MTAFLFMALGTLSSIGNAFMVLRTPETPMFNLFRAHY